MLVLYRLIFRIMGRDSLASGNVSIIYTNIWVNFENIMGIDSLAPGNASIIYRLILRI